MCGSHPLQQLALHEGLDDVVGGGEVPGLMDHVHRLETSREGVLRTRQHTHTHTHTHTFGYILNSDVCVHVCVFGSLMQVLRA